jgi:hypothetical protein
MIKLETKFVSGDGGFSQDPLTYTQIKRTDTVALYERSRDGRAMDFEVFIVKVDPKGKQIFATVLEDDREKYPSSGVFGFSAWSCINLEQAMVHYDRLIKEQSNPQEPAAKQVLIIPDGEFTLGELAEKNNVQYSVAFLFNKAALEAGSVRYLREERRNAKGKPSKIYAKA